MKRFSIFAAMAVPLTLVAQITGKWKVETSKTDSGEILTFSLDAEPEPGKEPGSVKLIFTCEGDTLASHFTTGFPNGGPNRTGTFKFDDGPEIPYDWKTSADGGSLLVPKAHFISQCMVAEKLVLTEANQDKKDVHTFNLRGLTTALSPIRKRLADVIAMSDETDPKKKDAARLRLEKAANKANPKK